MISFSSEVPFEISNADTTASWLGAIISQEDYNEGEVSIVFCDDEFLHKLNVEFLDHDTLTDVISFDYSMGKEIHGEIFISIERVKENANEFNQSFDTELARVMAHGILHYCGYKDKSESEAAAMRSKEEFYLQQRAD
ncbi:16S rRNA maturation RNase YbeY [Formosa sp. Hel1_33_131]|jgi:rRNA maturation RNase YbeY|uniref:rRNA maturation RNase YbeY n=1 Tax=Formosa sp. Hel1_33_131 TaxID=1336794 RepID=UPI00084E2FDF|nr:rRNA maturation RNase YbeY [Formosa sp. Hel1_33_131]AOR28314.1 16S rRNA maturation RNase YbeY [Formosa sp. Hel1_33_131]